MPGLSTKPDPTSTDGKLDKRAAILAAVLVGVVGTGIAAVSINADNYSREVKAAELDAGLVQGDQVTDLLSAPVDQDATVTTRVMLPPNRSPGAVHLVGPSAACFDQVTVVTVVERGGPAAEVTAHNLCDRRRFTALLTLEATK